MTDYVQLLISLAPLIVSLIIGLTGGYYLIFKQKLKEFTDLLVEVSNAVEDDSVTEAEFRTVLNKLLEFVGKPPVSGAK